MSETKIYGQTEGLAQKYGFDGINSYNEFLDLNKRNRNILLNMLYPGYDGLNDRKKAKINDRFANRYVISSPTSILWIVEQMKNPQSPMYLPNMKNKDLLRIANQYFELCDNVQTYIMVKTGKDRIAEFHTTWGGVTVPEYEDIKERKDLSTEEIEARIKKDVEVYNKKTTNYPISYESALEIKKYLMFSEDYTHELYCKLREEEDKVSSKSSLKTALSQGVSESMASNLREEIDRGKTEVTKDGR